MRVLLAGASGAIGGPLTRALLAAGHEVTALTRRPGGAPEGTDELVGDALDRGGLLAAASGTEVDAVVHELTALKKSPMRHKDMAATNRLRTEGTANLLAAAKIMGAKRFLTQSMIFGYGYGDLGRRARTEEDVFGEGGYGAFDPHIVAMERNEHQVFNTEGVDGISLRYALFYGAEGDPNMELVIRGRLPVPKGGIMSFVHVEDAAAATVAALERGRGGEAYNIADDEPVSWREYFTAMAAHLGAPRPKSVPAWVLRPMPLMHGILTGTYRVSNAKAKAELGWAPAYPTYREGIAALRHP